MSVDEWNAEALRRFGPVHAEWKFVCPSCGHIASVKDWQDVGASVGEVAFSCIGRHTSTHRKIGEKPGPCNYAGGGLFKLNPVRITFKDDDTVTMDVFAFADPTQA